MKRGEGFAFGTIITPNEHKEAVKALLITTGASLLEIKDDQHPDELLEVLARRLEKAQATALVITSQLPGKILSQLHNIKEGHLNVHLAGHEEPTIINPLPKGALLLILLVNVEPTDIQLQPLISSILRLE